MAWIRMDDGLPDNPKIEGLSDRAFRLYIYGLCLCGRKLSDGDITATDRKVLMAQVGATKRHLVELEEAGLWIRVNGHYSVNDWLAYNRSRDQVLRDREEARKRMRDRRSGERSPEHTPERDGEVTPRVRLPSTSTRGITAVGDHGVEKLLSVLSDRDDGTEGVIRSFVLKGASEADLAWAHECATGPGVESPTRVAVAELRKRLKAKEAA